MPMLRGIAAGLLAAAISIGASSVARAEYFVRPVLQYNGELQDGLSLNNLTSRSATFNDGFTHLEAYVDLSGGTIKTFLEMNGPTDTFGGATGVMGDQIRYTGSGAEAVSFRYDFDSLISASQYFTGTPPEFDTRYIGIEAHFAVYEAGSGANWADWTVFGSHADEALYVDYERTEFGQEPGFFDLSYASSLGADLFLTSGKSYDVFAAFNLIAIPGSMTGSITMNSLNTSTIGIDAPGGSFTSQSGEFLGYAKTPGLSAVPEPVSWAMMVVGFGFVGSAVRRSRTLSMA
jgi:hypothetical protein